MATGHMLPLVVRKRRPAAGHTVTVAAPLLFVLLALLAAFSRSPVAAAADSSPGLIDLTLVTGAQEKGAGILSERGRLLLGFSSHSARARS